MRSALICVDLATNQKGLPGHEAWKRKGTNLLFLILHGSVYPHNEFQGAEGKTGINKLGINFVSKESLDSQVPNCTVSLMSSKQNRWNISLYIYIHIYIRYKYMCYGYIYI